MAELVRGLMAWSGRSAVKSCVRAGVLTESGLTRDAQSIYDQLVDDVTWPDR